MNKIKILLTAVMLWAFSGLTAQTVQLEDVTSPPGEVTVDLDFSGFPSNVGAITLEVSLDSDLLTYTGGNISFNGATMYINQVDGSENTLLFSWQNYTNTVDLPSTLSLVFDYEGGFSSNLEFQVSENEIVTSDLSEITGITYLHGSVSPVTNEGNVAMASVQAENNEDISVPITTNDGGSGQLASIYGVDLVIEYDPSKLTFNGLSADILGLTVNEDVGVITLKWSSATSVDLSASVLANLDFTYLGGTADLTFLPGSDIVKTSGGDYAAVEFTNGLVELNTQNTPDGTLTIAEVVSTNGTADVEVPVSTTALNSVGAVSLVIDYDDAKLDYAGYTGNQLSGWMFTQSAGQLLFSKVDGNGMTLTAGDLLTLKFDYNSDDVADISFAGGTFVQHTDLSVFQIDWENGYIATAAEIATQPQSLTVAEGDNAAFSMSATGAISYQWESSTGSGWNPVSGETSNTLNLTGVAGSTGGTQYRCVVEPGNVTTNAALLAVVTAQPQDEEKFVTESASFSIADNGANGYQWQLYDGSSWNDISGATSNTLSLSSLTETMDGYQYRCVVQPGDYESDAATLTIKDAQIDTHPANQEVATGDDATFSVTATGATGYQWQESTDGGSSWGNLAGETSASLTVTASAGNAGNQYRVVVQPGDVESNAATLTLADAVITAQPQDQEEADGDDATFSVTATGATGYQWQESTDGGSSWGNLAGETSASLTLTAGSSNDGNQYRVVVQPGNVPSNAATLTVTYSVSGTVKYANTSGAERPINTNGTSTTEVILYESDGTTEVDRVNADINGDYVFNGVVDGDYVVTAVTDKPWGDSGVTLADYGITRSFVNNGTPVLQDIYWLAADVNSNGDVTLADYGLIRNRVNTSSTAGWSGPNWIFEEVSVNVSSSISTDVLGIVSGDVNATYTF